MSDHDILMAMFFALGAPFWVLLAQLVLSLLFSITVEVVGRPLGWLCSLAIRLGRT